MKQLQLDDRRHLFAALRLLAYVLAAQIAAIITSELFFEDVAEVSEELIDVGLSALLTIPIVGFAVGAFRAERPAMQLWRMFFVIVLAQTLALGIGFVFVPQIEGTFAEETTDIAISALVTAPLLWLNLDRAALGLPHRPRRFELIGAGHSPDQRVRWVLHITLAALATLFLMTLALMWRGETEGDSEDKILALLHEQREAWYEASDALLLERTAELKAHLQTAVSLSTRINASLKEAAHAQAQADTETLLALRDWRLLHETWTSRIAPDGSAGNFQVTRAELREAFLTSGRMVRGMRALRETHAEETLQTLTRLGMLGSLTLLALAMGVVEPLARRIRHIHSDLAEQSREHERLALVAESTDNAVLICDTRGAVQWSNAALREMTGQSVESLQQSHADRALGPVAALQSAWGDAVVQVLTGRSARARFQSVSKKGRPLWLDADLQPRWGENGRQDGFIAVINDISEDVAQRTRLEALLDAMPAGVLELDAHGVIVEANAVARDALLLKDADLRRRRMFDAAAQWVNDTLRPLSSEALPSAEASTRRRPVRGVNVGLVRADNSTHWLLMNCQPLEDGRVIACFIDVTEQRAQRTMLRVALDANRIGTWDWTIEGNHWQWSDQACAHLGYTPLEFEALSPDWYAAIHDADRPQLVSLLRRHLKDASVPFDFTARVRHRKGHWVWLHVAGAVVERNAEGRALRVVGIQMDISPRMQQAEQSRLAALTDSLTGLHNRTALNTRLQRAIDLRSQDSGNHFALFFFDLDRFKQINDTLGHAAGDELLRIVAQRLRAELRPADEVLRVDSEVTAARLGGDEFVIAIEGLASPGDAGTIAERILRTCSRAARIRERDVPLSVSMGVVTSEWGHSDPSALLRDADIAMYEAKRSGRGRWVRFEPWMQSHIEQRSAIEADLREALHDGSIALEYQPVMAISSGHMHCAAVEALARWKHPKRGTVAPAEFISIAEDSGLIHELGQLVLDKACADFVHWQASLGEHAPPVVSVNVSVAQLGQSGYTRRVQDTLERYHMEPGHLQLEVTESMAAQDDDVLRRLRALRGLGVRIALDDFGTGYSSLSCLHLLPISTVKIDRSFTADLDRSAYHRTLVEATVRVAKALGISCVAEGLETSTQLTLVRKMGCDAVQGYLISRSLDSRHLANWLVNWQQHVNPAPEPAISAFSDFDLFDSAGRRTGDYS